MRSIWFKRFTPSLRGFLRDRRGALSPIFGLLVIPLTLSAGMAIDVGRAVSSRNDLQDAVDATALSLAHLPTSTPQATLNADAATWLGAEAKDNNLGPISANVTGANGQLTVSASSTVATTITAIAGVTSIPVSASSTVKWGLSHVELALVLDNTGSMSASNKLPTLVSAASSLVDTLSSTAGGDPSDLKISVVPFSMTVNVGSTYQNASWMTGSLPSIYGADIFTTAGTNRFTLFSQLHQTWGGCVESRPAPYDVQEDAPTSATPATMFVPYFAPDEPDTNGFYNSYLADGNSGTWQQRQGATAKYSTAITKTGTNSSTGYAYGPNAGCALTPLLRLTDNTNHMAEVKSTLNSMVAIGDTNIPMGLMWGWHTLTPNAPFADGAAYNTQGIMKIVVLLTDGANENTVNSDSNASYYSGDGYSWQNRVSGLSSSNQNTRNAALDTRMTLLCNNMKAQHIIIYAVRIDVSGTAPAALKNCATNANDFFDVPNVPDLPGVFANIAGDIGQLRIAQ